MELSALELVAVIAACITGALIQGAIGFGMNLVIVPVLALVEPEALPATTLFLAIPLTIVMVRREHEHVDRRGVLWITVGRIPGSVLGAWIVVVLSASALSVTIGVMVVVAAVMSSVAPPIPVNERTSAATGFVSGTMGTASSIGGPPVALLYQHHAGPVVRSTLALAFAIGTAISIGVLSLAGEVRAWHIATALALTPAIILGVWLAGRLHEVLDAGWLRPAVIGFAVLAGCAAILRGLV